MIEIVRHNKVNKLLSIVDEEGGAVGTPTYDVVRSTIGHNIPKSLNKLGDISFAHLPTILLIKW